MNRWKQLWQARSWVIVLFDYRTDGLSLSATLYHKKQKNDPQFESFDSMEEVIKKFGKSKAYYLHVNGSGVLTRLVDFLPGYKDQLIVSGDKDDFYFTSFNDGSRVLTSFFRKNLLEKVMEEVEKSKLFLLGISCGTVPVVVLAGQKETISFDYKIEIENGHLQQLTRNETPLNRSLISTLFMQRDEAICKGIVASILFPSESYSSGFDELVQAKQAENFLQFQQFKFFGILSVSLILSALMVNYFYLNTLNDQVAQLEMELELNNGNLLLLDQLKEERIRKDLLVQSSGVNPDHFLSYFIDQIGSSVPKNIVLNEAVFFPLKENLKEKRKVEIRQEIIEISGFTPNSEVLDDWMEKMNRYEWIKSVELINYLNSNEEKAVFTLLIQLDK